MDFEEYSLHQEGIIDEVNKRTDNSYFKDPSDLKSHINTKVLVPCVY